MKIKIIIVILAVALVGLAIALFAVKKSGEDQHTADVSSIMDFSNQVVNADSQIKELNQANLSYSNDLVLSREQSAQLSNSLAAASVTINDSQKTIASAQDQIASARGQITNLNARIGDLETQNQVLDQRASELTNTIAQLNSLIADTRAKLNASETNNVFLQQALQQQMAQKAEIEHKFNDLDELRQQVKKIKDDLYISRRLQLMKNDNSQKKGSQLLMQRIVPVTNNPAGPNYGLNVEVGSDGSVRVIPPLGASTNAPAH
jgi:chromosome segregation ATPase